MKSEKSISIPGINFKTIQIPIESTAPMLMHRFAEKQRKQIMDKQTKKGKVGRAERDIDQEVNDCIHWIDRENKEIGFPIGGFKKALIRGCKNSGGNLVDARSSFNIIPDEENKNLVAINYDRWEVQEDFVRLNGKTADIRYRPCFTSWKAVLTIQYDADMISAEQLAVWVEKAGFGMGIGDWRPEKGGQCGTFTITKG